jgi:hypothetical protein
VGKRGHLFVCVSKCGAYSKKAGTQQTCRLILSYAYFQYFSAYSAKWLTDCRYKGYLLLSTGSTVGQRRVPRNLKIYERRNISGMAKIT